MSSCQALHWVRKTSQENYLRDVGVIKSDRFIEVNKEIKQSGDSRKAGKVLIDGVPCVFWYAVKNAIYGKVTYNGRATGDVLKKSVDGNGNSLSTILF